MYGLRSLGGRSCWWGARAIWRGGRSIDIPETHQQTIGGTKAERDALASWVTAKGLALLLDQIELAGLSRSDHRLVMICDGSYCIMADPKGSSGFLYMGAGPEAAA